MNNTVIFDMDGTLIDTEKYYQKYWLMASEELGYELTDEDFLGFRSLGNSFAVKKMTEMTGDPEAYGKIRNRRKELMEPFMRDLELPLKPKVREALELLKEHGCKLAVATATAIDKTEDYLKRAGLIDYFDKLISARMVENGKPAPDVYLYACEQLGVETEDTYAVEDAPNGVMSAYRAGLKTIMIPDMTEPDAELQSILTLTASNLLEAAEYIIGM